MANTADLKYRLIKEVEAAAIHCNQKYNERDIFSNWKVLKVTLNYMYGKNVVNKYELLLRSKFAKLVMK